MDESEGKDKKTKKIKEVRPCLRCGPASALSTVFIFLASVVSWRPDKHKY